MKTFIYVLYGENFMIPIPENKYKRKANNMYLK